MRCQILDPTDAVSIFEEWFDQVNIGLVFSNQFARVIGAMRASANTIPLVAPADCSHPLLADARVSHDHDP